MTRGVSRASAPRPADGPAAPAAGSTAVGAASWGARGYRALRRLRDLLLTPLAALLVALGVPPWGVSALGVAAAATALWSVPERPAAALAALAATLVADAADGAVARRAGVASGEGKLLDQLADSAAFALFAGAAVAGGLARPLPALLAVYAATALVAVALLGHARAARATREGAGADSTFWDDPRAGFWAHLPKLPVFVALPVALAGGPNQLDPAFVATALLAVGGITGHLLAGRSARIGR